MNAPSLVFGALTTMLVTGSALAQDQQDAPAPATGPDATQVQPFPGAGSDASPGTPDPAGPAGPQQTPDAIAGADLELQAQNGFLEGQQQGQLLVSHIINVDVVGREGEQIGIINDLVIDRQDSLIGVGGFLGVGERDVAIPIHMLEIEPTGGMQTTESGVPGLGRGENGGIAFIRVNATQAQLETAPEFIPFDR